MANPKEKIMVNRVQMPATNVRILWSVHPLYIGAASSDAVELAYVLTKTMDRS